MAAQGFRVSIGGVATVKRNIEYLAQNWDDWLNDANLETAMVAYERARINIRDLDAYDTGTLWDSMYVDQDKSALSVTVGASAHYAPYIEFGTRPHFPPLAPIRAWCLRHGMPESAAYPIARKIAEHGTPERPFLYPAYSEAIALHTRRITNHIERGLAGLNT